MCTALTLTSKDGYHFFGRNMDLEYNFNQSVVLVPRNFPWKNVVTGESNKSKYAVMGMGTIMENHPLFADGFNEKGLACAGLNFPNYSYYEENTVDGKINLGPYDLILWILSNFEKVSEVKNALNNINIVAKQFAPYAPLPTLHWIVYDTNDECIVIEKTCDKFAVYDNNVGVLANSPTFDWHITHLGIYSGLKSTQPENTNWHKQELKPVGQGLGLMGIPGDFYPTSRFVRAAYLKSHAAFLDNRDSTISEFFHILNNVAMVGGSVVTPDGKNDITLYTSCMCQEEGVYYYNTYNNNQINAISMFKEDLDASELKVFNYIDEQGLNYQN